MADYLNKSCPVANGDNKGLYPWMSVRAGGNSVLGNVKMTRPVDLDGLFLYNYQNKLYAEQHKYDNVKPSSDSVTPVPPLNGSAVLIAPGGGTGVLGGQRTYGNDVDAMTITLDSAANPLVVDLYARVALTSSNAELGAGDQVNIGLYNNGVLIGALTETVTVAALYGKPVVVELKSLQVTLTTADVITVRYTNLTTVTRGIVATDYQLIVQEV